MNRKHILSLVMVLLLFISQPVLAFANSIPSIDLEVMLHQDGSATFRDTRTIDTDSGTEHYLVLDNLEDSELLNFTVYDSQGNPLQDVGEWDVDLSREEKAGKYGYVDTGNGYELCFGFGDYGQSTFTIEYTLTNIVRNLKDGNQTIYWQMVNPDMDPVDTIHVAVKNDFGHIFSTDQTKIWGFGYEGSTGLYDEEITMDSGSYFSTSDYMVLLTIFSGTPFNTPGEVDHSEESILEQAMEGASLDGQTYDDFLNDSTGGESIDRAPTTTGGSSIGSFFFDKVFPFLFTLPFFAGISIFIAALRANGKKKKTIASFKATDSDGVYPDIPYDKEFYLTESMLNNTDIGDVISAFMLKWISEDRLVEQKELKGLIRKREVLALQVPDPTNTHGMQDIEKRLWNMVVSATGDDDLLSENEFNKYVKRKISTFNNWTEDLEDQSTSAMENEGYMRLEDDKVLFFKVKTPKPTEKGQELLNRLQGFKNFLLNYSLLNEREVSHVGIWDNYMIWAALYGIADKVYEQLKIADPRFEETVHYNPYVITGVNNFGQGAYSSQSSANSSSSFSGGGGGSFSGGGGGSFGGGSGGGTR